MDNEYEYIEIYKNVLTKELCDTIIQMFQNEPNKHDGSTSGGIDKNIKNTTDFHLQNNVNKQWIDIDTQLYQALNDCLTNYRNKYDAFQVFKSINDTGFQIQRYIKGDGFYVYHHDFLADKNKYRILTFLFYLNDIEEGGETEFFYGKLRIKPEAGKCVLFPASWTFPHRAIMPISDDKYIITGWLHMPTMNTLSDNK
jgi:Rps23 Pro-64 3,4-dihydroxylase Tpa1-like proline 4-hydroxylase